LIGITGWPFSTSRHRRPPGAERGVVLERQADQIGDRAQRLLGAIGLALRKRHRWYEYRAVQPPTT
jgi:hypothetical protein